MSNEAREYTDVANTPVESTTTGTRQGRTFSVADRQRSREGRAAAKVARDASTLRRDYLDEPHWLELASTRGLRLPPYGMAMSVSGMRRWLHKLGHSDAWHKNWSGLAKVADFIALNPRWPLRAWAGLMLEEVA